MQPVHITLKESAGIDRLQEPIQLGVPFASGIVSGKCLMELRSDNQLVPVQVVPTSYWPDGSLRWATVATAVNVKAKSQVTLTLQISDKQVGTAKHWDPRVRQVSCADQTFELASNALSWKILDQKPDSTHPTTVELRAAPDRALQAALNQPWQCLEDGPVRTSLSAKGQWQTTNKQLFARFDCTLHFYHGSGALAVELCLHNPNRAMHPGGLWDLGDKGSIHFESLAVHIACTNTGSASIQTHLNGEKKEFRQLPLTIYQDSSGGEHWNSRNHIDHAGKVTTQFRGFKLTEQGRSVEDGNRASPSICAIPKAGGGQRSVQVAYPLFWQNFPSAVDATSEEVIASLFPAQENRTYELQGGERKTQTLLIRYGNSEPELSAWAHQPLRPTLAPQHYENAQAFPWFTAHGHNTCLSELINNGLNGTNNFFDKREQIDEYGWRNFGDIFADHETLYQGENEAPFISHYNNQYDAIYGFARQYALSGDNRWFELMDDLARHVTDIDIYHTDNDRAEYNNGLFWHTDHYLDANTATHRTFTRHSDTSSTPGQTGGGPAAEHCYTTGLLYHYLLTGNKASKAAVLELAGWMVASHEGSGGLLENVLALKKRELPRMKALAKGKTVTKHRYPFTRGTGNYLTALIDASIAAPECDWLSKAGAVIYDTVHPEDNVAARNLLDRETGWSYLILLSAIARYLHEKHALNQIDNSYQYAAASFLTYTHWIQQNERPFLTDISQLEFPNQTWVAQDIRKAMLIFQAAELTRGTEAESLQKTGQEWLKEICDTLETSNEREYSRILVILMQNYGPHLAAIAGRYNSVLRYPDLAGSQPLNLTWFSLLARIMRQLGNRTRHLNLAKEKVWLKARRNQS